ncbi:MAG: DNA photolyase [Desulfobacteraceae bacterium]
MKIEKLFIDPCVSMLEETETLRNNLNISWEVAENEREIFEYLAGFDDPVARGKKTLYITRNPGALIKDCPGTSHYTCCDYTILHAGTFCTMDCSYCILQAYFNPPLLRYFADRDRIREELKTIAAQDKLYRIGTGEFTDSLIWETISDLPLFLVKEFSKQDRAVLELKTKTVNIESLREVDHNLKTIVSWSLNTPGIISSEERGTASLQARLKAAGRCVSWGYNVSFHFDPVVIYPGCEQAYTEVIDQIFEHVPPEKIVWISIGSFRFMPSLKPVIKNRFPDSGICYGEFVQGLDNKMRYFKPLRIRIYKAMVDRIKSMGPDVLVYFCMEDERVWNETLGFFPGQEGELGHLLDAGAAEHCRLDSSLLMI